jgi:hypothetical protein
VPLPKPVPGLVIRYNYLWLAEHLEGREDGQKDRPCAIVAAMHVGADKKDYVLVLPITHTPPQDVNLAIEIPAVTKQRLGLDYERSWVVLTEWNEFVWPGTDLVPVPSKDENSFAYGVLPPNLFETIRRRLIELRNANLVAPVRRTE